MGFHIQIFFCIITLKVCCWNSGCNGLHEFASREWLVILGGLLYEENVRHVWCRHAVGHCTYVHGSELNNKADGWGAIQPQRRDQNISHLTTKVKCIIDSDMHTFISKLVWYVKTVAFFIFLFPAQHAAKYIWLDDRATKVCSCYICD